MTIVFDDRAGPRYLKRRSWDGREEVIAQVAVSWPEYNRLYAHPFEWTWTNQKMRRWYAEQIDLNSLHYFGPGPPAPRIVAARRLDAKEIDELHKDALDPKKRPKQFATPDHFIGKCIGAYRPNKEKPSAEELLRAARQTAPKASL